MSDRLYVNSLDNRDHRTLFSESEVEAALSTFMSPAEAKVMAAELTSGPIVPGHPAFFADHLLDLLARLSPGAAERVKIARSS